MPSASQRPTDRRLRPCSQTDGQPNKQPDTRPSSHPSIHASIHPHHAPILIQSPGRTVRSHSCVHPHIKRSISAYLVDSRPISPSTCLAGCLCLTLLLYASSYQSSRPPKTISQPAIHPGRQAGHSCRTISRIPPCWTIHPSITHSLSAGDRSDQAARCRQSPTRSHSHQSRCCCRGAGGSPPLQPAPCCGRESHTGIDMTMVRHLPGRGRAAAAACASAWNAAAAAPRASTPPSPGASLPPLGGQGPPLPAGDVAGGPGPPWPSAPTQPAPGEAPPPPCRDGHHRSPAAAAAGPVAAAPHMHNDHHPPGAPRR
mmetsp:Transcript_16133/g.38574  ORF Transcript_16133/g.38574 Transcript_16133/m.38574 type:complete len:314 (+) Transcript_16133:1525-2466(+)